MSESLRSTVMVGARVIWGEGQAGVEGESGGSWGWGCEAFKSWQNRPT